MPKAVSRKAGPQSARSAPYPTPTAATTTDTPTTSNHSGPLSDRSTNIATKKAPEPTTSTTTAPKEGSFLDLTLPGEASRAVPVYDSCAQIRSKIKSLLEKHKDKPENAQPGEFLKNGKPKPWTAKAFCDAINVSTSSYQNFMKKTGHMGGAENGTFYGAYVFFEKKRIWEGAKKSATRLKMESEWGPKGLMLQDPSRFCVTVGRGEDPRDFIPKLYGGRAPDGY